MNLFINIIHDFDSKTINNSYDKSYIDKNNKVGSKIFRIKEKLYIDPNYMKNQNFNNNYIKNNSNFKNKMSNKKFILEK